VIGLLDSGLGGLTVVQRVRERIPNANLVFLADQAHVPYGGRPPQQLLDLLRANLAWLDAQGVDTIVMACNTSCAIAEVHGWPNTRATVLDLIDSAATAVQRAGHKRVGVVATAATVKAGSYGRTLRARIPGIAVFEVPAPALVPLVEAGQLEGEAPHEAVAAAVAQLPNNLDAIIYACTHYPVLDHHFASALAPHVIRIDPAVSQAERAAALTPQHTGHGTIRYVTTGDPEAFRANIIRIMHDPNPNVESQHIEVFSV